MPRLRFQYKSRSKSKQSYICTADSSTSGGRLKRLVAFADAGADCLYAPGVQKPDEIAAIVKAVAPKPVNVLVSGPSQALTVSRLADLGVRRVSVGSALARVAWGAFIRAARSIMETGSFAAFADAAPNELDDVFSNRE